MGTSGTKKGVSQRKKTTTWVWGLGNKQFGWDDRNSQEGIAQID